MKRVNKQRKDKKRKAIGRGGLCPKCGYQMHRYQHSEGWLPRPNSYYFEYWDKCRKCRHLQHYECAKVHVYDTIIWDN